MLFSIIRCTYCTPLPAIVVNVEVVQYYLSTLLLIHHKGALEVQGTHLYIVMIDVQHSILVQVNLLRRRESALCTNNTSASYKRQSFERVLMPHSLCLLQLSKVCIRLPCGQRLLCRQRRSDVIKHIVNAAADCVHLEVDLEADSLNRTDKQALIKRLDHILEQHSSLCTVSELLVDMMQLYASHRIMLQQLIVLATLRLALDRP